MRGHQPANWFLLPRLQRKYILRWNSNTAGQLSFYSLKAPTCVSFVLVLLFVFGISRYGYLSDHHLENSDTDVLRRVQIRFVDCKHSPVTTALIQRNIWLFSRLQCKVLPLFHENRLANTFVQHIILFHDHLLSRLLLDIEPCFRLHKKEQSERSRIANLTASERRTVRPQPQQWPVRPVKIYRDRRSGFIFFRGWSELFRSTDRPLYFW